MMQAYQDGETRNIGGVPYVRQGGQWHPRAAPAAPPPSARAIPRVIEGPPREAAPQTPEHRELTAAEIDRQRQLTQQQGTQGHDFQDENSLRSAYHAERPVADYESVLPSYVSARRAADTPAGDLQIVYAFAKIMDPSTGVREGEQANVAAAGSPAQRVQGYFSQLAGGGRLTPEIRQQLLGELESRVGAINSQYSQARHRYREMAQRYGFDRDAITGPHAAQIYQDQQQQNGRAPEGSHLAFWDDAERPTPPGGEEFARDLQTALNAGTFRTPDQIVQYGANYRSADGTAHHFDISPAQAAAAIRSHGASVARPSYQAPDISAARGPGHGGRGEAIDAGGRHAADMATAGLATPAAAGMDSIVQSLSGDPNAHSFGENLYNEQGVNAYDEENHAIASTIGTVAGGVLIPTTVVGAARSAAAEALSAGGSRLEALAAARTAAGTRLAAEGGIYGGIHGTATGHGDITERVANGVVEAVLNAAGGGIAGRYAPGAAAQVHGGEEALPPLVDPATGRMNHPLESASPAGRVGAAEDFDIHLPMGAATDRGGAIVEKGLDISPASAGLMNDSRAAVSDEATAAAEGVAARYGSARTMDEAGANLQTGARNWIQRATVAAREGQPSVVGKAYNAIPISPRAEAVLTSTRATLDRLTSRFQSNPELAALEQNQQLVRYRDALASGGLSWEDQKALRSEIGNRIGAERFSESPSRNDLRALYASLSEDMRATAAAQGPRALRSFERANNLNREVENRIEGALVRLLGDDSKNNPERAAAALQTITQSGRGSGNLAQLAQIRSSLQKGSEWNEVASALIRLGGQPAKAEGRSFNPQTFINWYAGMSEPARNMLFSGGTRTVLRQRLDDFVAVAQRLAGTDALRNTSQTASSRAGLGTVAGASAIAAGLITHPIATVAALFATGATGAANYGIAKLWTSPRFVQWATGYVRVASRQAPTAEAMSRLRQSLMRLMRASPAIAAELGNLDQRLFGGGSSQEPNP